MNKLDRIDEFRRVLADYKISDTTTKVVEQSKFVLLAAISSAGRNTMIRELLTDDEYHFVVSDTTRKPRVNDGIPEKDGREYWFKTEAEFLEGLINGQYVEAAIIHNQQVSGVSVRELDLANRQGKIAISDIDVQGADRIHSFTESCIPVFVLPPSYSEWRQRMRNRGLMTENELNNRLTSAKRELQYALDKDYYHFLVNNSLKDSIKGLDQIAHGRIDPEHEAHGRQVAKQILQELQAGTQGT